MPIAHALWIALSPFSQTSRLGYDHCGMLLQFKCSLVLLKCAHACEHFLRLWAASYNNVHICKQQNFCLLTSAHSTLENLYLVKKGGNIFLLGLCYECGYPFNQRITMKMCRGHLMQGQFFAIQPLRVWSLLDA